MKPIKPLILTVSLLAGYAQAASFIKEDNPGDAATALGPDFFVNDAAPGGGDNTFNQPGQLGANRNFPELNIGDDGSLIEITGFAFPTSLAAAANDATQLTIRISYLGADGTFNTADDTVIGEETVAYSHSGAGVYYVVFDNPFSAVVIGSASRFRLEVIPTNDAGNGSVRIKGGPLALEEFNGPKLTVAGTSIAYTASDVDTDNDGLPDEVETNTGDFVNEANTGTDPNNADTDGDNLKDGDEVRGDAVTGFKSNPHEKDTDMDGLDDDVEVLGTLNTNYFNEATNPDDPDSDDDSVNDGVEINTMGTDPNAADTDGDGLNDPEEDVNLNGVVEATETDPLLFDTDGDGLDDKWEIDNGLDALVTDNSQGDPDGDLLLNIDEYNTGLNSTDPNDSDTDNDKLDDKFEFDSTGLSGLLNPASMDTDNDGLSDSFELDNGLDPFINANLDGDAFTDAQEVIFYGTDPDDINSFPGDGVNPAPLGLTPVIDFGPVFGGENLPVRPMASDSDALATAIINEAVLGGADLFTGPRPNFSIVYPSIFPAAGTEVEITGLAWVVTGGGNAQGDLAFEFYDPEAADGDPDFDGVVCETRVGVARASFIPSGTTGVSYFEFAEPVSFTSAGTSLAVRIQSTGAMRLKGQNGFASGLRYFNDGSGPLAVNTAVRLTLFGSPANEVEPVEVIISDLGFEANGDFFIDVEGGVLGKIVTSSNDLEEAFAPVIASDDGANRFTIAADDLDPDDDGRDFFRVEIAP